MKLALALLALSSSALAQTAAPAKPVTQHAAGSAATTTTSTGTKSTSTAAKASSTAAKSTSTLPKVVGVPHTLYALKYIDIRIGKGPVPEPFKYFTVTYTGWFPDGKKFDSSFDHDGTFTFPYGGHRVITGWDTGFEGMRVGGKRRLFVPYQLAYGITGRPPQMPAKANLIFDVELVSFSDKPPAPPAPTAPRPSTPPPAAPATPPAGSTPATPPPAGAPATPPPAGAPATPPSAAAPAEPAKPATPPNH